MTDQVVDRKPTTEVDDLDQSKGPADSKESISAKLLPVLVPLGLSILAAMTYGLLRGGYVGFYSRYGISPEDVGLSQQQIVFGALRFCLAGKFLSSLGNWAPIALIAILAFYVAVWRVVRYFCLSSRRFMNAPIQTRNRVLLIVAIYLSTLLAILITAAYLFIGQDQTEAWEDIRQFRSVRPSHMNFLMVQADPASVVWLSKEAPPPRHFPTLNTQVMYIGHNDKMAIIHDPRRSLTWRVPENAVLITIRSADGSDTQV